MPAFGIALIPVTLAAALARAAAAPAAQVAEVLESISADQWQKLLLCIAFDAAGDLSESLPFHGLLELALGPLDYFVLRYLFEDSFAIPVAGLLEEELRSPSSFCRRRRWRGASRTSPPSRRSPKLRAREEEEAVL